MCCAICSRSSSDASGTSDRKRRATLTSASSGQAWNLRVGRARSRAWHHCRTRPQGKRVIVRPDTHQSNTVQLTSAGNWRARTRNLSPTGLKHSTTCRFLRTCEQCVLGAAWTAIGLPVCFLPAPVFCRICLLLLKQLPLSSNRVRIKAGILIKDRQAHTHSLDEELPAVVRRVLQTGRLDLVAHLPGLEGRAASSKCVEFHLAKPSMMPGLQLDHAPH